MSAYRIFEKLKISSKETSSDEGFRIDPEGFICFHVDNRDGARFRIVHESFTWSCWCLLQIVSFKQVFIRFCILWRMSCGDGTRADQNHLDVPEDQLLFRLSHVHIYFSGGDSGTDSEIRNCYIRIQTFRVEAPPSPCRSMKADAIISFSCRYQCTAREEKEDFLFSFYVGYLTWIRGAILSDNLD